jgi:lysozyme
MTPETEAYLARLHEALGRIQRLHLCLLMTDRDVLHAQLIQHEGLRVKPYTDTVGKLTIGVGRNLTDKGLSRKECMYLLDNDLDECLADLATFAWFRTLDAVRQRVVIDMRFTLGPSRFRGFTATLAAIAAGNYQKASAQMLKSKWAQQVKGRAVTLARMMMTGLVVWLLAVSASAQPSLLGVLQFHRTRFPTPMSAQQTGQLLNDVAASTPGYALFAKSAGNRCPSPAGPDVSCDILVWTATGQAFDCLYDSDGLGTPTWNEVSGDPVPPSLWVQPVGSPQPPPPPADLQRVLDAIQALRQELHQEHAELKVLVSRPFPNYVGRVLGFPVTLRPEVP